MGFPAGRKSASPFCAIRPSHKLAILTSNGASSESTLSGLASFFSPSLHSRFDSQDGFSGVVWREFGLFYENHILHRVWKTITSVGFSGRSSSLVVSPSFGISVGKRTDRRYLLINRRVLAVRQHSVLNSDISCTHISPRSRGSLSASSYPNNPPAARTQRRGCSGVIASRM